MINETTEVANYLLKSFQSNEFHINILEINTKYYRESLRFCFFMKLLVLHKVKDTLKPYSQYIYSR